MEASALNVDVAVIGAGPAGSTLAALLAGRGVSVAIIDRDRFPRDKVCGEFLSWDATPVLDLLGATGAIDAAGAPRIASCRIVGLRRSREFAFPEPARGVSRMLLDELLLDIAARAGATRLDGWAVTQLDSERSTLTIERDGALRTIHARVLAGAWGRWGRFDTQLQRAFVRDRDHRSFGFKRHYTATAPRTPGVIELYSFAGGYLGVNDVEGGITNICGLVHSARLAGHKGRWDAFVETIRREEAHLEALYAAHVPAQHHFLSSDPVVFLARSPVEGGIFLTGDAAGVIDPLTGNGMAMAVQSALLAATSILRALSARGGRTGEEAAYCLRHRALFAPRIAWSRRAARVLSHPRVLDASLEMPGATRIARFLFGRTRADHDEIRRLADDWTRA